MKYSNRACSLALAGLVAGLACGPALAQGGAGKATLSVGITIVAPGALAEQPRAQEAGRPRIAVDPAYAIDPADPLREARIERVALADGGIVKVISY